MAIRVLHVVTYMGRGGLETMLMNYYRHMDRDKVQFDFLVHRDFEADYDAEILSLGGRIYHMPRLIPWSKSYKKNLKDFLRSHPEYRVVHVHQDCLSSVALQCAEECGIPVRIAHSHSSSAVKNLKYLLKLYYMRRIPRFSTHLFACSRQAGDWMFAKHPYTIVPNAIAASQYAYSEEMEYAVREEFELTDQLVIGHVGNFTPAKNHRFLLEIFQEVKRKQENAKLLLVGGGDGIQAMQEKADTMGISDAVIFAGTRKDVPRLMQAMDLFVFPSLYEGLPVTLIEAQAAGLPCVISDAVSQECEVTKGLLTYRSLSDSAAEWAECVLKKKKTYCQTHTSEISDAGYEIEAAAKKLQAFYIQHA